MRTIRAMTALLTAVLLLLTVLPVSAASDTTVTVASVTAKAGDTVTVSVDITRVENVASVEVHLGYDTTALRCVDAQMSDAVKAISLSNINTTPVSAPDELWLTAVGTNAVVLEGMVMNVTFEVLDTAKAGVSPLTLKKVTVLKTDITEIPLTLVNGGVTVEGDGSLVTDSTQNEEQGTTTTTAQTVSPDPTVTTGGAADAQPTTQATASGGDTATTSNTPSDTPAQEMTVVSPGGETVALPEQTVVDISGSVVTDAAGEPTRMRSVAVMLSNAVGKPGETVSIYVSLSEVSALSALGIAVHYDTSSLAFEGGECVGFVKDQASMSAVVENKNGIIDISAMGTSLSGSGDIAVLRFNVKDNAKNGEYRLAVKGNPLLQAGTVELPVKSVTGKITIEGGREGNGTFPIALLAVLIVMVIVTAVLLIVRRKKASPAKTPTVVDVSGESDE